MIKFSYILLFPLMLILATGCDKIEAPFVQQTTNNNGGGNATKRKVLVEEFTGFRCKNCPDATKLLHGFVDNTYKDNAVMVAIHAGELSMPDPPEFTEDYRVLPDAQSMYDYYQLDAVPYALINRVKNPADSSYSFLQQGQWAGVLATETAGDAEASLAITTSYNTSSRQVNITVDGKYLVNGTANEFIHLYLVEEEVEGRQDSLGIILEEYRHKSMLRAFINGLNGEKIKDTQMLKDETFNKTFTYTLPAKVNPAECAIVAFVRNNERDRVRQAELKLILP